MKDTYDNYDPHETEAVVAYKAEVERKRLQQERDGAAVMMLFLPLASAADPQSALGRFTHWVPFLVTGIIVTFASAVAMGYV